MNFQYHFVGMRKEAPDPVKPNEIWLNVGNRCDLQVLDHHSGQTDGLSSADLVFKHYKEYILKPLTNIEDIVLITHRELNLDVITAIWLTQLVLNKGVSEDNEENIEEIVIATTENEQGYSRTDNPELSWKIVMRLIIKTELNEMDDDNNKILSGIQFLNSTLKILQSGNNLASAAKKIATPKVRLAISQANRDYLEDLSRSVRFQVRLPVIPSPGVEKSEKELPQNPPQIKECRWALTDAIYIENPASKLFKELARGDTTNSPLKQGYSLMVVKFSVNNNYDRNLFRYIISTDPLTGLYLKGLGKALEEAEQIKEDKLALEPLEGRERVDEGTGRHGYNVASPWFDGQAYDFTYIDSPSIKIQGEEVTASVLSPKEVLDIIWDYGDPAKFINTEESEITLFRKAELFVGWVSNNYDEVKISEFCPDLSKQVKHVFDKFTIVSIKKSYKLQETKFELVEQQIWCLDTKKSIWIGVFKLSKGDLNAKELAEQISLIRNFDPNKYLPKGVKIVGLQEEQAISLTNCRMNPSEVSIDDQYGYSALAFYHLARGEKSLFFNRADKNELESVSRIFSRDRRNLLFSLDKGMLVVSTRDTQLHNECDFHNPKMFRILVSILFIQKYELDILTSQFPINRSFINPIKASKRILNDRWKLIYFEQEMSFDNISEKKFAQRSFEELKKIFGIEKRYNELRRKIISLELQIKNARANYYQQIAFLVTTILAPLALTASFLSGTQMQREFSKIYFTFLPPEWQPAGWLQFSIIFFSISFIVIAIWLVVKIIFRRKSILRQFFK